MSTFISGLFSLLLLMAPPDKQLLNRFTEQASKEHKYIAVYFSGSDWCSHCHYFNNHVLQKDSIQQLINNYYVYYNADFPQRKKLPLEDKQLNDAWAEVLNPEGVFPMLIICDEQLQVMSCITRAHVIEAVTDTLKKYSNR
ncbi:thioredoxin family protein [Edaphocola aurantiacus]|uniref:thioredoxin family protein n=1 Tax=Edaphocola aurantiacus TaxID=2601682 RepID=UPI001C938978|nr:thioredoxin family protein [Edaphocola aurantiacus]